MNFEKMHPKRQGRNLRLTIVGVITTSVPLLLAVIEDWNAILDEWPSHGILDKLRRKNTLLPGGQKCQDQINLHPNLWSEIGIAADHDFRGTTLQRTRHPYTMTEQTEQRQRGPKGFHGWKRMQG